MVHHGYPSARPSDTLYEKPARAYPLPGSSPTAGRLKTHVVDVAGLGEQVVGGVAVETAQQGVRHPAGRAVVERGRKLVGRPATPNHAVPVPEREGRLLAEVRADQRV